MTITTAKFSNPERSVVEVQAGGAGAVLVALDGPDIFGDWREAYSAWPGETPTCVAPVVRRSVVDHFAAFGFDAIALLNLSDVERKFAAQPVDLPPKCATALSWVNAVQVAYASGQTLPDAPCTLPELFAEIAPLLKP